ncbi:MAG: Lrp/AsnC family transcriptional regulator [Alphaproteobacteria bacterium]|nr:Lrp/AsnC family transcriptional regulator [Alphaproteobacteria bacterium]
MSGEIDQADRALLDIVQQDARLSFREIARRAGLSTPTVAERLRRLEAAGVVTGYAARVDGPAVGRAIEAYLRVSASDRDFHRVTGLCASLDDVLECHHVTGEESFLVRVAVPSVAGLEELISRFRKIGTVRSSLILSSPVAGKPVRAATQTEPFPPRKILL